MYRFEAVLLLLAMMPFIMACIYSASVAPRRRQNMNQSLQAAVMPVDPAQAMDVETTRSISEGAGRVQRDFDSLYSYRLLLPALMLSALYCLGFSLGISTLLPGATHGYICWPFTAFGPDHLKLLSGPAFAVLGAYTFGSGILVRRAFMADFSKNVMWGCINRLVISVGFAILLHIVPSKEFALYGSARNALCFAIAFFPAVFITALRKRTRKALGVECATQELDIQLIQGIDVWKEERLAEEGVESVQNMATADIFSLLPKVHFPLRTIVDWMDQAIFIQRFPDAYIALSKAGFAISAIRAAEIGNLMQPDPALLAAMSKAAAIEQPVLVEALTSLSNDAAVRVLARLWQSGAVAE